MSYIWPEARSSAAGLRSWNLIDTFLNYGWHLTCASASKPNLFSALIAQKGVATVTVQQNSSCFDDWIGQLKPDYVIFDRFVTEEQFGWRVEEQCPDAIRIVDSQDLHFLRRAREQAIASGGSIEGVKNCQMSLFTDTAFREIASFLRSDCTLLLSDFEKNLMVKTFNLDPNLFYLSRFHYESHHLDPPKEFSERSEFMMIGNFRHRPNVDGLLWFYHSIWPKIRSQLPSVSVRIYGAYPSKEMLNLSHPEDGFYVEGSVQNHFDVLRNSRVNLAPLRFGAGIKGKISDGWWAGTPNVTTSIGAEGMHEDLPWGGEIALNEGDFTAKAVRLYSDESFWKRCQSNGYTILNSLYQKSTNEANLMNWFIDLRNNFVTRRSKNLMGSILRFHRHRSTKYFSKWIEEKNRIQRCVPKMPLQ
jgi:hypothetical protein